MCRKIFRVILEAVFFCSVFQTGRSSSCSIYGSVASCAFQKLSSVPALPPHITHLFLEMNQIHEITATSLFHLPLLQQLDLGNQRAPLVIRDNAFSKQTNLTRLVLGSNRNLHLEPLAFAGLSSVTFLDLSYCNLNETILSSSILEPLTSLEKLDLFANNIKRLHPAVHFTNKTSLKDLNLKLNPLSQICEEDLSAFKGRSFSHVSLNSVPLRNMSFADFDWEACGNPFRNITFEILDISNTYLSLHDLKKLLKAIQGTKINKLMLSGHYGKGFSLGNLPDPDNTTFEGLRDSDLQHLDLSKNQIFALELGVFSPFKTVQTIDISQNKVNRIHPKAFEGLQVNLRSLNLSHNLLGDINSFSFASLTNLRVLDLSHNHIGFLGHNSFSGLINLQALFLTGNALRSIGFPAPLLTLQILKLDDNKLKSVNGIAQFANATVHLDVSNNRLRDLGDVYMFLSMFKNLQHLHFSHNPVEHCFPNSHIGANQLRSLHLDHIFLQSIWSKGKCLDLFQKLGHLEDLSLSHNGIRTLPIGIFSGLEAILKIDLSSNALTTIQADVIPRHLIILNLSDNFLAEPQPEIFKTVQFLDLSDNRFHCGPRLKKLLSWIRENDDTLLGSTEQLKCEFPLSLRGVSLLDFYDQEGKQRRYSVS